MLVLAFVFSAALLAVTPGPGIFYVFARTVSGGRRDGLASCAGVALGGLLHVLAAAVGLSALLTQSAWAFGLVKLCGAAYLIYIGLRMLLQHPKDGAIQAVAGSQNPRRAFLEGIVVEGLNVKTALFFLAFLPHFVDMHSPVLPQIVALGLICVTLNTLVDVAVVLLTVRAARRAGAGRQVAALNRIAGVTMIGLGTFLGLARRDA